MIFYCTFIGRAGIAYISSEFGGRFNTLRVCPVCVGDILQVLYTIYVDRKSTTQRVLFEDFQVTGIPFCRESFDVYFAYFAEVVVNDADGLLFGVCCIL